MINNKPCNHRTKGPKEIQINEHMIWRDVAWHSFVLQINFNNNINKEATSINHRTIIFEDRFRYIPPAKTSSEGHVTKVGSCTTIHALKRILELKRGKTWKPAEVVKLTFYPIYKKNFVQNALSYIHVFLKILI